MRKLVQGIVEFRRKRRPDYAEAFARLALRQKPDALYIACSDSRVQAFRRDGWISRLVSEGMMQGNDLRQVIYLIPGFKETAALTFTAERRRFDEYVAVFDAAAEKTQGARAAPLSFLGIDLGETVRATVVGAFIGACIGLLKKLRSRRNA